MSRINDDGVHTGFHQRGNPLHGVVGYAHARSNAESAFAVLACGRFVFCLGNVLIGDQSDQVAFAIHHRQFFYLVTLQYFSRFFQVSRLLGRNQVFPGHDIVDQFIHVLLKAQVTVGDDAQEFVGLVHYRYATDVIFGHEVEALANSRSHLDGHRVVDHAVFCALHNLHLLGLFCDGHVLMNHADASFPGNGDGHLRLRHRIHGGRHEGNFKGDVA